MRILFLLALLWPSILFAADTFRSTDPQNRPVVLVLTTNPCTNAKVLEALHGRLLDDRRFQASRLTYNGQEWQSCWVEVNDLVYSLDEENAPFQPVPRSAFKDDAI